MGGWGGGREGVCLVDMGGKEVMCAHVHVPSNTQQWLIQTIRVEPLFFFFPPLFVENSIAFHSRNSTSFESELFFPTLFQKCTCRNTADQTSRLCLFTIEDFLEYASRHPPKKTFVVSHICVVSNMKNFVISNIFHSRKAMSLD